MKSRLLISVILLTGIIFPVSRLNAQIDSLKERKNIVEIFHSLNYSLKGVNPYTESNYHWGGGWGLSYIRFIGKRNIGLEFSTHSFHWGGSADNIPDQFDPVGFINASYSRYFSLRAHYPLLDTRKFKCYVSGGATLRTGSESLVVQQAQINGGWQDGIMVGQPQRDLGISGGSRFSWYPWTRIVLSADVRYTRFIYRYTTSSEDVPSYKGTPQNHLCLQAKLGFCF